MPSQSLTYMPNERKVETQRNDDGEDDSDIMSLSTGISKRSDSVLTKKTPLSGRVRWSTGAQHSSV